MRSWVNVHAETLRPKTAQDYKDMIERKIVPRLGKIQLAHLRPSHIQAFYTDLFTQGGEGGEPLSARTVAYHASILKKALAYAVEVEGLLAKNPGKNVPLPKGTPKRIEPFSVIEEKKFLAIASGHRLHASFQLSLFSGARKGELLALNWSDVDLDSGRMTISKNRIYFKQANLVRHSTKGGEGRRIVTLDPDTVEVFRGHRRRQGEERLLAGHEWQDSEYVFVNEFGAPIHYSTPTALFTKLRKQAGLREQRLHDLRHFHATVLLEAGMPLHVVAQRMGHRDAMVTATIYAHVTNQQAENASLTFAKAVE
jgi:integrase